MVILEIVLNDNKTKGNSVISYKSKRRKKREMEKKRKKKDAVAKHGEILKRERLTSL